MVLKTDPLIRYIALLSVDIYAHVLRSSMVLGLFKSLFICVYIRALFYALVETLLCRKFEIRAYRTRVCTAHLAGSTDDD